MTKEELLEMLRRNQNIKLEHSYDPCKDYYEKLSDLLKFIKDDKTKIKNLSSLEKFEESRTVFDDFVRRETQDNVKEKLNAIYTEVTTWVTNDPANITKVENYAIGSINIKKRRSLIIASTFIILLAILAIAFTIAHIVLKIKNGDQLEERYKYFDLVAEAVGTLDFVLGVIAFVIERFLDIKKDKVRACAQEGRENGNVEGAVRNIQIIENGSSFKAIGRDDKSKNIDKSKGKIEVNGDGNSIQK